MWLGLCLVSIAQPSREASAQQAGSAAPELLDAILRHAYRFDGGNLRVVNGRVPEDIANFYVPPGTRVLGSVVFGSSVRIFATTRAPADSLRELYTRALAPAGWQPLSWGGPRGGFVDARRELPMMFCRDGAQLQIQRQPGAAGAYDLVLDYRDGIGSCEPTGMATARATAVRTYGAGGTVRGYMSEQPRFPTLYSPEEATAGPRTRCFPRAGYRGDMGTSTVVAATTTAAELLRHYASQLEAAGWRASAPGGRQAAAGAWTLADTSGTRQVTLEVVESGHKASGCFDVEMRMSERRQ
jgi:hypothetical protein